MALKKENMIKQTAAALLVFLLLLSAVFVGKAWAGGHFKSMDALMQAGLEELQEVEGIGEVMAKRISDGLVEKQAYIQELRKEFQLSQLAPAPEGDTICFTGKSTRPRSEMHQAARDKGLVPVDAVTSTTKYLVVADPNSTSSKVVKARKMGVTILSEEQFWAL